MSDGKAIRHTVMAPQHPAPLLPIPRVWPFKRLYFGWAIVTAAVLASFGQVPVFGPVLGVFIIPMQEDLGWSRATLSFGFTVGSMTGSVVTFIIGSLLDRYGARIIVVSTGIIITSAMLGLASMDQPWQFWIFFGMGRGAALAGIQMGASVAIANWFVRKRGRAIALKGLGLRIGQATFPLVIFAIMAVSTWRHAYLALAGLTFLCVVLPSALFIRRRPEDFGLHPDGEAPETSSAERSSDAPRSNQRSIDDRKVLRTRKQTRCHGPWPKPGGRGRCGCSCFSPWLLRLPWGL